MGRAPCCDKTMVTKGPWSPEEDAMLKAYIDTHGTGGNWIALPQKIGLKRCGKSCRLRWLNYLRPNIKHGGFSDEEDNTICSLYISIGSRWSVIAAQLPGRTDNDIKNYWNTKLKKKLLGRRKQVHHSMEGTRNVMSDETQRLSNSAVERLQLHIQLQNNSPNGTDLWPKLLHPTQERMIQNLTLMHNDTNTPQNKKFDEFVAAVPNNKMNENSTMHELGQLMATPSSLSSFQHQVEFDNFINTTHLDSKETHGGYWWPNEIDTKSSTSLSSDDSNSVNITSSDRNMMMFHNCSLRYDI